MVHLLNLLFVQFLIIVVIAVHVGKRGGDRKKKNRHDTPNAIF